MKYDNPIPPEGINSGDNRPVREFFVLGGALFAVFALMAVVVLQFGVWVAPFVPFSWEKAIERPFVQRFEDAAKGVAAVSPNRLKFESALQALADKLAARMDLEDGMVVTLHFIEEMPVNAFATVGGHIFVYRGLLEQMESEDALAMVLAHEIAHVKHRDVLASLSGTVVIALASSVLLGDAGSAGNVIEMETLLTTLHFSRDKEKRADLEAFRAVVDVYGHGGGAEDLFQVFDKVEREKGAQRKSDFMTSHPLTMKRIQNLRDIAQENHWPMSGNRQPFFGVLSTL